MKLRLPMLLVTVVMSVYTNYAVVSAADMVWKGGTGTWDTEVANQSWNAGAAVWDNTLNQGDSAVFSGSGGTVSLLAGSTINLGGLKFTVAGYTLAGGTLNFGAGTGVIDSSALGTGGSNLITIASNLTGSNGLTIAAHGNLSFTGGSSGARLLLSGDNTGLSGNINITTGLVAFANSSAAGSSAVAAGSGNRIVLSNGGGITHTNNTATASVLGNNIELSTGGGTIRVYGSQTLTLNGVVSGSGSLTKTDGGTLLLANLNNTFTGSVTVGSGTLQLGNLSGTQAFAFSGSSLSVAGAILSMSGSGSNSTHTYNFSNLSEAIGVTNGTLAFSSNNGTTKIFNGAVDFTGTNTIRYSSGGYTHNLHLNGNLSGDGVLNFTWSGGSTSRNVHINGTGNNYTGKVVLGSSSGAISMYLNQTIGEADWTISNANWTVMLSNETHTMKSLNSSVGSKIQGAGANSVLYVGSGNTDSAYAGTLEEASGGKLTLVKTGTGSLTLSGANTYTGNTEIRQGTLIIANSSGNMQTLGNGILLINGGTFKMDESISSLSTGGVNVIAGRMDIGNGRVETISLTDAFAMGGGTMTMDILGNSSFDQFMGQGSSLMLSGGTLELYGFQGFENEGVRYALFSDFKTMDYDIVDGSQLTINGYDKENWLAIIGTDGSLYFEARAIPEPSACLLFGIASFFLLSRRKRTV